MFGTHPPSKERVENLTAAAAATPGVPGVVRETEFRAAMKALWPDFVDDQLKLNDFGASDYLLTSLGADGWTPELLYARGELYRRKATMDSIGQRPASAPARSTPAGTLAALWRGRGLARLKLGQEAEGKADLRNMWRGPLLPGFGDDEDAFGRIG